MKKLISYILALLLAGSLTIPALGAYDPEENYMARMLDAVAAGNTAAGEAAQLQRDEKIEVQDLKHAPIRLKTAAPVPIMYAEAGSYWLGDEWKLYVGEVVLNRVESPEFPDTIREVLEQPGQYYGRTVLIFPVSGRTGTAPSWRCGCWRESGMNPLWSSRLISGRAAEPTWLSATASSAGLIFVTASAGNFIRYKSYRGHPMPPIYRLKPKISSRIPPERAPGARVVVFLREVNSQKNKFKFYACDSHRAEYEKRAISPLFISV